MEKMSRPPGFLPAAAHGVLKSLLENPLKLPLHHEGEVTTAAGLEGWGGGGVKSFPTSLHFFQLRVKRVNRACASGTNFSDQSRAVRPEI